MPRNSFRGSWEEWVLGRMKFDDGAPEKHSFFSFPWTNELILKNS